ncbi:MAG: hypothetical protein WCK96_05795 [Methylococcales bacterium]
MLQYLLKVVVDFLKKPSNQRAIIYALRQPSVRQGIVETADDVTESIANFFASISIKIVHRKNETQVIIDASAKINYSANNINSSKVIQGEHITDITVNNHIIINNFNIPLFNHSKEDIIRIEEIQQVFNETLNRCIREQNSSIEIKNVINSDYKELNKELVKKLSKITDYSMLQKALGTED